MIRIGGGVLIYIRYTFKWAEIKLHMSLECVAINVMLSTKMKFNIVTLCNPPSNGASDLDELLKQLNCSCESILQHTVNWLNKGSRQKLKTIYSKHNFQQTITEPTRLTKVSKALIDLIFMNRTERVTKTYNLITGLSDHSMVVIVRKLTKKPLRSWCNDSVSSQASPRTK